MAIKNKGFRIFVIVFVVLTGAGFGTLTGFVYSHINNPFWIAVAGIAGALSSFILALCYLFWLEKISVKYSRFMTWLLGTVIGILSGIVCTTIVHGIMTCQLFIHTKQSPMHASDGFWSLIVLISELVGAAAGLVVGGICSWIYVSYMMDKGHETTDLA